LNKSARQYLVKIDKIERPPVTAKFDDTLRAVIALLFSEHVHRLYILGPNDIPVGLVSMSDIIPLLLPQNFVAPTTA